LDGLGVKEIHHPSGGPWGGCYIDDEFEKMLKSLFPAEWIDKFEHEQPSEWVALFDEFQKAKNNFYVEKKQIYRVKVPLDFTGFLQDRVCELSNEEEGDEEDLEDWIESRSVFGQKDMVTLDDVSLEINIKIWKQMFDAVIQPDIDHVKDLLKLKKLRGCKYLCLVGGLSISPYFRERMTDEFGPKSRYGLTVIKPKRPMLSVVEGAAHMGVNEDYIAARVLKCTYGQSLNFARDHCRKIGVPEDHIKEHQFYNEHEKRWYVSGIFQVMARKHETIKSGHVVTKRSKRPTPDTLLTNAKILYSEMERPLLKSHGQLLGTLETNWTPGDKTDKYVMMEFHFSDTLIKVEKYREQAKDDKQIRYITNYK